MSWLKDSINSGFLQRRVTYYAVLGMTITFGIHTWEFIRTAREIGYEGVEVGAIIAAVWTPMTALQGYCFNKHKQHEGK